MYKTFDTVDGKIAETEFFLKRMAELSFNIFEFNCYFSAFLSASRSSTLALQQFKHIPRFEEWYRPHQTKLKSNKLAKFFLETRNEHVHGGHYPVSGGSFSDGGARYYFYERDKESNSIPNGDVVSLSREYFLTLLNIVYDCYVVLGVSIDPQQHYTKDHFASMGKTIEHAEYELFGWVCSSLTEEGFDESDRWHHLRSKIGQCQINHLFYSYLSKVTPSPEEADHFQDFEFTPEEKGWIYIPAGFSSIKEYAEFVKNKAASGHCGGS